MLTQRQAAISSQFGRTGRGRPTEENRAQLVLGSGTVVLRLIFELEQEFERAGQAEFLHQPTVDGARHTLAGTRMAAAAVRPVQRPQLLARTPLLQQQLIVVVENEQREGTVQCAGPRVAGRLVEMSDFPIRCVH